MKKFKVGLVDDHALIIDALTLMINTFSHYEVVITARDGKDLLQKLSQTETEPDVLLLDVNMPVMNGFETASWIYQHKPGIKMIALSMNDDDLSLVKMLRCGCKGYLLKDSSFSELQTALDDVMYKGFHYNEFVSGKLIHTLNKNDEALLSPVRLSDKELEFLKLACTEMTYKEIAVEMIVAERTIDGYREKLADKLHVKSRVGLVLYAIKNGIVQV